MSDDIQDLLSQLDDPPKVEKPVSVAPPVTALAPSDDLQELLNKLDESEPEEVATLPMPQASENCTAAAVGTGDIGMQTAPGGPPIDVYKVFQQYNAISDEIITACRSDRQEAQDAIDLCKNQITNAANPNAVPRMYVDGLVKSIEVKSNINATVVKVVDTLAKLLAATKSQINISNNNNTLNIGSDRELEDILSAPMGDEY